MDSAVFQVVATLLAAAIAAFWAAYKWRVTYRKDSADIELAKAEFELAKLRKQIDEEVPFCEVEIEVKHTEPGQEEHDDSIRAIINVFVTNRGNRVACGAVNEADFLTVARISDVSPDGAVTLADEQFRGKYLKIVDGEPEYWKWISILPGATKTIPFYVTLRSPGVYYIELKIPLSPEDKKKVAGMAGELYQGGDPVHWSGSAIVPIPGDSTVQLETTQDS